MISILKQIVWETQNAIKISVGHAVHHELLIKTSFSDNLNQDADIAFSKKYWLFWDRAQNMLNFGLRCSFSLNKWKKTIDDLHISHNASGMGANMRVLLIRNSSSHSSLDVNGLELPCLAATLCFTRLCNQGNSLMRSWYLKKIIKNRDLTASCMIENSTFWHSWQGVIGQNIF